jgi:hypothetical protein
MTRQLDWFAVSVEPRRKSAVARSLRSIGLEEFVPIYSQRRRLFPGYGVLSLRLSEDGGRARYSGGPLNCGSG